MVEVGERGEGDVRGCGGGEVAEFAGVRGGDVEGHGFGFITALERLASEMETQISSAALRNDKQKVAESETKVMASKKNRGYKEANCRFGNARRLRLPMGDGRRWRLARSVWCRW